MNFPAYQLEQLNVPDDIHKFIGIRPKSITGQLTDGALCF